MVLYRKFNTQDHFHRALYVYLREQTHRETVTQLYSAPFNPKTNHFCPFSALLLLLFLPAFITLILLLRNVQQSSESPQLTEHRKFVRPLEQVEAVEVSCSLEELHRGVIILLGLVLLGLGVPPVHSTVQYSTVQPGLGVSPVYWLRAKEAG